MTRIDRTRPFVAIAMHRRAWIIGSLAVALPGCGAASSAAEAPTSSPAPAPAAPDPIAPAPAPAPEPAEAEKPAEKPSS
jgi:hypothetical protein